MPGPSLHLQLIRETAERWQREGTAPVELASPEVVDALYLGAVAPDSGYYPGAQPFITDLAHYLHTGALTRNLLAEAYTERERAFAWGWASHVLVDALVHPAVNRAAAELRQEPGQLTYADDPEAHNQIEIGLNAFFDARFGTPTVRDVFGPETGFVRLAYLRTYDARIPRDVFATAFSAAARYDRPLRTVARLTHAAFTNRSVRSALAGAGLTAGSVLARTLVGVPASGLFQGVEPTGALLAAVESALVDYHVHMDRHVRTELSGLPDYNLDTGAVGEAGRDYRRVAMTEQQLIKYRET